MTKITDDCRDLSFSLGFEFFQNIAQIRCSSLLNLQRVKEIFPQNLKLNEKNGSLQSSVTAGLRITSIYN